MGYSTLSAQDTDNPEEFSVVVFFIRGVVYEMFRVSANRTDNLSYRVESVSNSFRVIELF